MLPNYSRVRLQTNRYTADGVGRDAIGYIIEVHGENVYEVEFSAADGTTIAQMSVPQSDLELCEAVIVSRADVWILMQGAIVLGRISNCQADQPAIFCIFTPEPEFEPYRHLFDDELDLLNRQEMDEWVVAYEKIDALGLRLVSPDGCKIIDEILLHIDGNEAWFRY